MAKYVLGTYVTAHFDIPVEIDENVDIKSIQKKDLRSLIFDGTIKSLDEDCNDLINDDDLYQNGLELFLKNDVVCGTFRLSKFNYILDENLDEHQIK